MSDRDELHPIAGTHEEEVRAWRQQKPLLEPNPGPYLGAAYLPSLDHQESQFHSEGVEPSPWYDVPLC